MLNGLTRRKFLDEYQESTSLHQKYKNKKQDKSKFSILIREILNWIFHHYILKTNIYLQRKKCWYHICYTRGLFNFNKTTAVTTFSDVSATWEIIYILIQWIGVLWWWKFNCMDIKYPNMFFLKNNIELKCLPVLLF